jgi:hypothetical protein
MIKVVTRTPKPVDVVALDRRFDRALHAAHFAVKHDPSGVMSGQLFQDALAPLSPSVALGATTVVAAVAHGAFHEHIQHASPEEIARVRKISPWLAMRIERARDLHAGTHHGAAAYTYSQQFENEAAKANVDARLKAKGWQSFIDEKYGLTLTWKGVRDFLAPFAPIYAAAAGTVLTVGASWAVAGLLAISFLGKALRSKYLHPFAHMTDAELEEKAPPLAQWYYKQTAAGHLERINHYVHHRGKGGPGSNFDFGLGLGDRLLGKQRRWTDDDIRTMQKQGHILNYRWPTPAG